MKIQAISSKALSAALGVSAKCMQKRNAISILDYVLLSMRDGRFMFTTSTSESQLTIPAPITLTSGTFTAPVALPIGSILSFLGALPDCVVNMTLEDNHSLTLDYCMTVREQVKSGRVVLSYMDGTDFPQIPAIAQEGQTSIVLPASDFFAAVNDAQAFSSREDVRLILNSLCIDISEDRSSCYFVSTDTRQLVKKTYMGSDFFREGTPCKIIVYNRFFRAMSAFTDDGDISIDTDGNNIRFHSGDTEFVCKALEGKYPNYNSIIPVGSPYYAVFDAKEMAGAIRRVSIFSDSATQAVMLRMDGGCLLVEAADTINASVASEQVLLEDVQCKEGFSICLGAPMLLNAMNTLDGEVRMLFSSSEKQVLFVTNEPVAPVQIIIMPIRRTA